MARRIPDETLQAIRDRVSIVEVISAYVNLKRVCDKWLLSDASIVQQMESFFQFLNKFMDDIAGAINRREIAEKQYDEEAVVYQNFLHSWRGSVARTFSSQARADSK